MLRARAKAKAQETQRGDERLRDGVSDLRSIPVSSVLDCEMGASYRASIALNSIFSRKFGESVVSFRHLKRYNEVRITEATSFGKDKGSVNRRGTEPFVFTGAFFVYARVLLAAVNRDARVFGLAGETWLSG